MMWRMEREWGIHSCGRKQALNMCFVLVALRPHLDIITFAHPHGRCSEGAVTLSGEIQHMLCETNCQRIDRYKRVVYY